MHLMQLFRQKEKAHAEEARYESFKELADEQAKLIDETSNRIQRNKCRAG